MRDGSATERRGPRRRRRWEPLAGTATAAVERREAEAARGLSWTEDVRSHAIEQTSVASMARGERLAQPTAASSPSRGCGV